MEDILIVYKEFQSNNELGRERYQGLTEVTFPDISFRNHPITITKMFSNQSYHRWIVKNITHEEEEAPSPPQAPAAPFSGGSVKCLSAAISPLPVSPTVTATSNHHNGGEGGGTESGAGVHGDGGSAFTR